MIQYQTTVDWDLTLIDLEYTDIDNPLVKGLVEKAIKITTGAPAATAGMFIPGAEIINAVDATKYQNTGTTASPVWSLVPASGSGITELTGDVEAGPGDGSQAASVVAIQGEVPKSVNVYDSQETTSGGAAAEAFTITGVAASDRAYVQLVDEGSNTVTVVKAVCTLNTVTVTFDADPGNDAIVNILVTRDTGL